VSFAAQPPSVPLLDGSRTKSWVSARAMLAWIAWGAGVALFPFGLATLFFRYKQGSWPGLSPLFGSGQAFLVCVGMFATAAREMLKKRDRDNVAASFIGWLANLSLGASMAAYGFIQNDVLAGRVQSVRQQRDVATVSLVLLALGIATAASSIGLAKRFEAKR
jgi:hypothetical protein